MHLATFRVPPLRVRKRLRLASAVLVILICLSTLLIKQHSAADLIAGCALAVAAHSLTTYLFSRGLTMIIRPFNAAYLLLLAFCRRSSRAAVGSAARRSDAAVPPCIALCAVNIIGFFVYKGRLFVPGCAVFAGVGARPVQLVQRAAAAALQHQYVPHPDRHPDAPALLARVLPFSSRRSVHSWRSFPERSLLATLCGCADAGILYHAHTDLICGFNLTTLGFYRPRLKDLPGVTGALLTTAFAAFLVDLLLRHRLSAGKLFLRSGRT